MRVSAIYRLRRSELEHRIEELIALLDVMDGEADLEEGGDRELDPAESGLADRDALDVFIAESGSADGLHFDGSGREIAQELLQGIKVLCQSPRMRRRA